MFFKPQSTVTTECEFPLEVCKHPQHVLSVILFSGGVWEFYAIEDVEDKTPNDQLKSAQPSLNCYWDDCLNQEAFQCCWFQTAVHCARVCQSCLVNMFKTGTTNLRCLKIFKCRESAKQFLKIRFWQTINMDRTFRFCCSSWDILVRARTTGPGF